MLAVQHDDERLNSEYAHGRNLRGTTTQPGVDRYMSLFNAGDSSGQLAFLLGGNDASQGYPVRSGAEIATIIKSVLERQERTSAEAPAREFPQRVQVVSGVGG